MEKEPAGLFVFEIGNPDEPLPPPPSPRSRQTEGNSLMHEFREIRNQSPHDYNLTSWEEVSFERLEYVISSLRTRNSHFDPEAVSRAIASFSDLKFLAYLFPEKRKDLMPAIEAMARGMEPDNFFEMKRLIAQAGRVWELDRTNYSVLDMMEDITANPIVWHRNIAPRIKINFHARRFWQNFDKWLSVQPDKEGIRAMVYEHMINLYGWYPRQPVIPDTYRDKVRSNRLLLPKLEMTVNGYPVVCDSLQEKYMLDILRRLGFLDNFSPADLHIKTSKKGHSVDISLGSVILERHEYSRFLDQSKGPSNALEMAQYKRYYLQKHGGFNGATLFVFGDLKNLWGVMQHPSFIEKTGRLVSREEFDAAYEAALNAPMTIANRKNRAIVRIDPIDTKDEIVTQPVKLGMETFEI